MNIDQESRIKLDQLSNKYIEEIIEKYAKLCKPSKITILDDSEEDLQYIRDLALKNNEESNLKIKGHTIHFDGLFDQGRDLENTRILIPKGKKFGKAIKTIDREIGLKEILSLMEGIMQGKQMLVKFYCLGPVNSKFSIPALQITDSAYVAHSEDILYRQGYQEFRRLKASNNFFHFIHSAGDLENNTSKNIQKRRIYMDLEEERVFTINNQYAGNSVGLKKLALRLAISKANKEDWLCEHMFIMGVKGKNKVTYLSGAFPTACGKTSTAMIPGQTIVGDDIAYLRIDENGIAKAANVEQGIFGIIKDINPDDDPLIYEALVKESELIFSNVLVNNNTPYWLGMGKDTPESGVNFSGDWFKGKTDSNNKIIHPAHKNSRYTIKIKDLDNADTNLNNPEGVEISGIIYGGRDSNTSVPVLESLSWSHGVFLGAIIESETVPGTSEKEGVVKHNPMSNIEFLTAPLGIYIKNHLKFGQDLDKELKIFTTNYFLKENNQYLNQKTHKKVWLLWMVGRVHNEYKAIETPMGLVPEYDDLKNLFKEIFNFHYTKEDYIRQFSIRIQKYQNKLKRIKEIFNLEQDIPESFYLHLNQQTERLKQAEQKHNKSIISPYEFLQDQ